MAVLTSALLLFAVEPSRREDCSVRQQAGLTPAPLLSPQGQLTRACVELAKNWRMDKYLRRLDVRSGLAAR